MATTEGTSTKRPGLSQIINDSNLLFTNTRDLPNPYLRRQREAADGLKSAVDNASVQELIRLARPSGTQPASSNGTEDGATPNRSNSGLSLEVAALFNLSASHVSEEVHIRRKTYLQDLSSSRRKTGVRLQQKTNAELSTKAKQDAASGSGLVRVGMEVMLVLVEGLRQSGNHGHANAAWSVLARLEEEPAGSLKNNPSASHLAGAMRDVTLKPDVFPADRCAALRVLANLSLLMSSSTPVLFVIEALFDEHFEVDVAKLVPAMKNFLSNLQPQRTLQW